MNYPRSNEAPGASGNKEESQLSGFILCVSLQQDAATLWVVQWPATFRAEEEGS